ncbi:MAG: hypothetical protein ABWZ52_02120 [Acidimicrobiales bacterium]
MAERPHTFVRHTTDELRKGLECALGGAVTPQLREVESELRLAGFLTGRTTVTAAGERYLRHAPNAA